MEENEKPVERTPVNARGGLQLPKNVGVSEKDQADDHLARNTIDAVEKELERMGLAPSAKPAWDRPDLTAEQLTTSVNRDYTVLYAQHLAWYNFTSPLYARVRARMLGVSNEMTDIEVRIRKNLRAKNKNLPKDERFNEKDIDDETWSDPRYQVLTKEKQKLEQMKLEIEAYLGVMEGCLKVISRQIEIRKIELGSSNQENAMPGRGKFPPMRTT